MLLTNYKENNSIYKQQIMLTLNAPSAPPLCRNELKVDKNANQILIHK